MGELWTKQMVTATAKTIRERIRMDGRMLVVVWLELEGLMG